MWVAQKTAATRVAIVAFPTEVFPTEAFPLGDTIKRGAQLFDHFLALAR